MYLTIIFISPLFFLLRKKWGGFILNSILYFLAICTIIFFGIGVIFWILAVGHAGWHLRKDDMAEHAELIAKKMVEQNKAA
jgi:hypothetical protein